MAKTVRIGTRGSKLALVQSNWVLNQLQQKYPQDRLEMITIKTTGDQILNSPLSQMPDKGVFTKELDTALLENKIDLAVHSLKDLPTVLTQGIAIAAITEREEVEDAFVSLDKTRLEKIALGSTIATSSLRRQSQLLHFRPDLKIVDIRGNVDTRLKKLAQNKWAGMVLAVAGLKRLGLQDRITEKIPLTVILPAVGQGSFAITSRDKDVEMLKRLEFFNHTPSELAARAERCLLKTLEGGCHVPIGAFAQVAGKKLTLQGCLGSLDGKKLLRDVVEGSVDNPEAVGMALADKLLQQGGQAILAEIRKK